MNVVDRFICENYRKSLNIYPEHTKKSIIYIQILHLVRVNSFEMDLINCRITRSFGFYK